VSLDADATAIVSRLILKLEEAAAEIVALRAERDHVRAELLRMLVELEAISAALVAKGGGA
jgi:hypothetical protein